MPVARYIKPLTTEESEAIHNLYRQTTNADIRTRCQMVLLSNQGYSVVEISKLTLFDQDSVLYWFDRYETEKLKGLEDRPRSGRPPKSR